MLTVNSGAYGPFYSGNCKATDWHLPVLFSQTVCLSNLFLTFSSVPLRAQRTFQAVCPRPICLFVVPFKTEQSLELLLKFEKINACQLDVAAMYMKVLLSYGQDLEQVRVIYQTEKASPTTSRNLPPIAGRIAWARQLFRRIEAPMKVFKKHPDILKVSQ